MNILLSIASRGRPAQLDACLDEWVRRASAEGRDTVHFYVGIDDDDPTAAEYHQRLTPGIPHPGGSRLNRTKVQAINETMAEASECWGDWDLAVIGADDMVPVVDGWDWAIRQTQTDPATERLIWYDDGRQNVRCTIPVITRAWYERRGYVYHPSYKAYYCDDEQTQQAQEAGELIRIVGSMFLHNHACWGAAEDDETYKRNRKFKAADRHNFGIRKQFNWPKENPTAHLQHP